MKLVQDELLRVLSVADLERTNQGSVDSGSGRITQCSSVCSCLGTNNSGFCW